MTEEYKNLLKRLSAIKGSPGVEKMHKALSEWDGDLKNVVGLTRHEKNLLVRVRRAKLSCPIPDPLPRPSGSKQGKVLPNPDPVVDDDVVEQTDLPPASLELAIDHPDYNSTPLQTIYHLVNKVNTWNNDGRSPEKAYLMACFSELAYVPIVETEYSQNNRYKVFPSRLYEFFVPIKRKGIANVLFRAVDMPVRIIERPKFIYLVFKLNGLVVIAVRGTDFTSLGDWVINFKVKKSGEDLQKYHRGFWTEAKSALDTLVTHIGSSGPVYFTGHSLGGAVASILGEIWPETPRSMTPYIFASPMVTTPETRFVRPPHGYAFPNDVVPHLPSKWAGFDSGPDLPELIPHDAIRLTTSEVMLKLAKSIGRDLSAHKIERYRSELGKLVSQHYPETSYKDAISDWIVRSENTKEAESDC